MIVAAVVCAAAGAALFQFFGNANHGYIDTDSLFWWWIFQWINPASETEHGWLVLGIAVFLAARNLGIFDFGFSILDSRRDARHTAEESFSGNRKSRIENRQSQHSAIAPASSLSSSLAALLAGLLLHAVGFAAQQARVSIVALLIFVWGLLRLGGGPRWGRACLFPVAFLAFAIPFNALDSLGFWLRLWVIEASTAIAHGAHIGVIQNGTQLLSPDGRYSYDVAAACSGVRSLMALAALSLLIGYLSFRTVWRRALVFGLCFPLVYVGNVARITSIVFAAQAGGSAWGERIHDVMGYGIFVIVLGGVLLAARLLERWLPEECHPIDDTGGGVVGRGTSPRGRRASRGEVTPPTKLVVVIAAVVVGLAIGEAVFLHRLAQVPSRGGVGVVLAPDGRNPVELPAILNRDWVGWHTPVTDFERQILPPDTGFSRMDYVATRGGQHVFLSIVLSGRDRSSIHRPELCLLGQGWTIEGRGTQVFSYPDREDASFAATLLHVKHRQQVGAEVRVRPEVVAYWFVNGDRVVPSYWGRLAWDAWNRVTQARPDRWAYVLVQTDASDGDPAAQARIQAVLNGTLPVFQRAKLAETRKDQVSGHK